MCPGKECQPLWQLQTLLTNAAYAPSYKPSSSRSTFLGLPFLVLCAARARNNAPAYAALTVHSWRTRQEACWAQNTFYKSAQGRRSNAFDEFLTPRPAIGMCSECSSVHASVNPEDITSLPHLVGVDQNFRHNWKTLVSGQHHLFENQMVQTDDEQYTAAVIRDPTPEHCINNWTCPSPAPFTISGSS